MNLKARSLFPDAIASSAMRMHLNAASLLPSMARKTTKDKKLLADFALTRNLTTPPPAAHNRTNLSEPRNSEIISSTKLTRVWLIHAMPRCSTIPTKLLKQSLQQTPLRLVFSQTQTLLSYSSSSSSSNLPLSSSQTITTTNTSPSEPHEPHSCSAPPVSSEIFKSGTKSGSHKWGSYKLGDLSFYSLIENFAASLDFRSLEQVLLQMKRERRVFIEKNFILMFRAYGKAHLPEKAVDLFHRMEVEFHCRQTVKSFNSVLNVIVQEGLFNRALEFYYHVTESKSLNIHPNALTFNLVIKTLCRLGLVDQAVEVFRWIPLRNCAPDTYTYSTLMHGLCNEGRIDEAVSMLDEMQIEGIFPNPVAFNVLISALCKKVDLVRASKLVDNMFLKGCVPNEVTYNALVHGLCLKGKLDKAVNLLNQMVSNNCMPNDVTFGTLINGFVKHGRALDGVRVLISLEERGHRGNEYIYSSLISGLFKEGKSKHAMQLWKEMIEKGCEPNTVVYSALIDGLCREGKPDAAREYLLEMKNKGYLPNSFTYSSLMRGFFEAGDSHKAILVWKEMTNNNCIHNEVCYSILIDGLCKNGKLKMALMVWKQMLSRGIKLDVVAYSSMIHGFCNAQLVEQGMKLFHQMLCLKPELQPDMITYNILLNALCINNSISRAIDVLNIMLDQGCDPDFITCDIFLKTLRENMNPPQDGREFLDELVVRLVKRQKTIGASKIIEVMLHKFLLPEASTWALVVQQLCKPKNVRKAISECWSNLCC